MKSFRHYIFEELNSRQKYYIDREISNADDSARDTDFSDHVFGGPSSGLGRFDDKDVKILPFDISDTTYGKPPASVERHLGTLGYKIHDWNQGLAIRANVPEGKKSNPIRIRKILEKTKQHPDQDVRSRNWMAIQDLGEYENLGIGPHISKGFEIMITRHPYHVAEQSTNKGWRSCMAMGTCPDEDRGFIGDMEDKEAQRSFQRAAEQARRLGRAQQAAGENAHLVPRDILGGAHMAYLIRKGDYKLKRPLARISLKPFHSDDIIDKASDWVVKQSAGHMTSGTNQIRGMAGEIPWKKIKPEHTILRPVGRTYHLYELARHPIIRDFTNTVDDFIRDQFPMRQNVFSYHLDHLVQKDHGQDKILENPDYRHWAKQ